jgi:arsenate reductase
MSDFPVVIFHNPGCGTSRNTLGLLKQAGYEPKVVEYLKTGWTSEQLGGLFKRMGVSARDVLRARGTPAEELGLLKDGVSDETIIAAMIEYPAMVERPIVETPKGAVLARPVEAVLAVLDRKPASYTKQDGTVVKL